jgi:hypothetical protein
MQAGQGVDYKFREVASKGPLDALIRELCKMTGVLWILSRAHALVLSLSLTLCLCVFDVYDQISFSFSPVFPQLCVVSQ